MAIQVKESKLMLKSVFSDESSGKMKKRTVTISGINSEASLLRKTYLSFPKTWTLLLRVTFLLLL